MQYKTEDSFKAALKKDPLQGVYLLYGGENYLIDAYSKKITGRFGGDFSSFNLQKLDGRKPDCDLLLDAVETLPLMAGEKCVLLDSLELKSLSASGQDKLMDIVSDIPPGCVLVITAKAPAFDPKSAAAKKLIKLCAEKGEAVELGPRNARGMASFLASAAKKNGCELPADLAGYILRTLETDMTTLSGEMEKICAYAGGGTLTRAHVDAAGCPRTEAKVFDLSKAILAGNAQRAMEILRDLFYLREQPVAILSVLSMSYADLYRARVARDAGKSPSDVVALFGYKGREFRVTAAWNSRLSAAVLRRCLCRLLDCDRRMKSTPADPGILLEQTVAGLLALQRQPHG